MAPPAPIGSDRAADGPADGTTRSTSRARRASSTSACRSSCCTMRRRVRVRGAGRLLEAGCAWFDHSPSTPGLSWTSVSSGAPRNSSGRPLRGHAHRTAPARHARSYISKNASAKEPLRGTGKLGRLTRNREEFGGGPLGSVPPIQLPGVGAEPFARRERRVRRHVK